MSTATVTTPHKNNWATGAFQTRTLVAPDRPTAFDALVYKRGLEKRPDLWKEDRFLRAFAKSHRMTKYVPEWFLAELGIADGMERDL